MIIDEATKDGFEAVAEAREYLLRLGRQEVARHGEADAEFSFGSHVVAPVGLTLFDPSKRLFDHSPVEQE